MLWKIVMVSLGVLFCLPTLSSADTMFGITGFETKSVEGGKIYNFSVDSLNRIWAAESAGVWVLDASTGSTIRNLPIGSGKLLGPARDLVIGDSGVVIATVCLRALQREPRHLQSLYQVRWLGRKQSKCGCDLSRAARTVLFVAENLRRNRKRRRNRFVEQHRIIQLEQRSGRQTFSRADFVGSFWWRFLWTYC